MIDCVFVMIKSTRLFHTPQLQYHRPPDCRISVRTLVRRSHRGNLIVYRVVRRPALTARHRNGLITIDAGT